MKYQEEMPELSPADRHALAEMIVEQDGVSYDDALVQIAELSRDLENPKFLLDALITSAPTDQK